MELFYSNNLREDHAQGKLLIELPERESVHCVRVLRHQQGDSVYVSSGNGNLYLCRILSANPRCTLLEVLSTENGAGTHNYRLWMAVAPTKNLDRFEWFTEKAVEMGIDRITPLLCAHSERKVYNRERGERLILAASKQSIKTTIPQLDEITAFKAFLEQAEDFPGARFIAYCDQDFASGLNTRNSLQSALETVLQSEDNPQMLCAIGPEGDFSAEEVALALKAGFKPLSLGPSRLRTETAALLCVSALYTATSCK